MNAIPVLMPLLFVGFLVLIVAGAIYSYRQAKKRREEFAATAAQRGWGYAARDDRWTTRFDGAPFGTGHDRRAGNVVSGTHDGRSFIAFDYHYATTEHSTNAQGHSTTREVSHDFSVIAVDLGVPFPGLWVTPEGFFGRAIGRLLNRDIELESEAFNRAFTVVCPDRKFASDVLHPQMMEFLLQFPDLAWSFRSGSVLAVRDGRHSIPEIDGKLQVLDGIADRVPEFVWQAFRGPTPPAGASAMPPSA